MIYLKQELGEFIVIKNDDGLTIDFQSSEVDKLERDLITLLNYLNVPYTIISKESEVR
ncbi:MAG: hypothetical protein ACRDD7_13955 [Peptostreptococcaceae bacterium]